ncbi:MAG TPA: hypothetical protein EYG68_04870 [Leucothrix mucor]|nr:hypothetical protein [Leucothrix mucor]
MYKILTERGQVLLSCDMLFQDLTPFHVDIEKYRLFVGDSKSTANYYKSPVLGVNTSSVTVSGLPTDGRRIYVKFKYKMDGQWYRHNYSYNAVNTTVPALLSPVAGATLTSDTEIFTWTDNGVSVSKYRVSIGSCQGCSDYYKSGNIAAETNSLTVSGLPTDGSKVYVKFLYVDSNSGQRHIHRYVYIASGQ